MFLLRNKKKNWYALLTKGLYAATESPRIYYSNQPVVKKLNIQSIPAVSFLKRSLSNLAYRDDQHICVPKI